MGWVGLGRGEGRWFLCLLDRLLEELRFNYVALCSSGLCGAVLCSVVFCFVLFRFVCLV